MLLGRDFGLRGRTLVRYELRPSAVTLGPEVVPW